MSNAAGWWRDLSESDRYRFYTRLTFQLALVLGIAVTAPDAPAWVVGGAVVAAAAAWIATEGQPVLAIWRTSPWPRYVVGSAIGVLVVVMGLAAVATRRAGSQEAAADPRTLVLIAAFYLALCVVPFLRHRWWILTGGSVAAGLLGGPTIEDAAVLAGVVLGFGVFGAAVTLLSWWGLRVLDDLEHAREVEGELKVAEERLRFSRDLHDVVGRGFSAVAVKSELAATLARAGHADRAVAEMDEVKALAVESMDQMRALVRGYRDISLASEVAGARSLLAAAGCTLHVEGDAAKVPSDVHAVAAWVVREGTTNVVKHSSASWARLALGPSGMSLRNDAPNADALAEGEPRSGHRGLIERLDAVGASLSVSATADEYLLEVRWPT